MMQVRLANEAVKQYNKLPVHLQQKVDKQFTYLIDDFRHPSLNAKKMVPLTIYGKVELTKVGDFIFMLLSHTILLFLQSIIQNSTIAARLRRAAIVLNG